MATKTFKGRIQNKHDTEANWNAAVNFKPFAGELIIYDEDNTHSTPRFKVGDGSTLVSDLPFVNGTMKFGAYSFSYEDGVGNIGTFGPTSIELDNSTYKAVYDTTSIGYKNISTDVAYDLNFPTKSGTLALTSDIPDTSSFVTISGAQTISGKKTFTGTNTFQGSTTFLTASAEINDPKTYVAADGVSCATASGLSTYYMYGKIANRTNTLTLPLKTGTVALTSDIDVTAAGNNTFTGNNTFNKHIYLPSGSEGYIKLGIWKFYGNVLSNSTNTVLEFPSDISGKIALTSELPVANSGTGTTALTSLKIGDTIYSIPSGGGSGDVTAAGNNTFTGTNTFNNGGFKVNGSYGTEALSIDPLNSSGTGHTGMTTLKSAIDQYCSIELGAGSLSISSKGTNNNTGHINISTGANGVDFNIAGVTSAFKVLSDGIKVNSKTKYCGGKIDNIVSGTTYSLTLPSKSGTLALTNDVPIKTATLSGTTLSITLS